MNIVGIDYESVKDGLGVRTVIYVSGCSHNCYMCHNPQTHNVNNGVSFTDTLQEKIIEEIKKRPYLSGITWSGGDPLHEKNLDMVLYFTTIFRKYFPDKSIWLYTGYTWEEIFYGDARSALKKAKNQEVHKIYKDCNFSYEHKVTDNEKRQEILSKCDVLVDGKYIDAKRDITLTFKGSSNQRIIDIQQSLNEGEIILKEM